MKYSYLALGDSYTIGEQVIITHSFPCQTIQLLRKSGFDFCAPEIIAATGWTTVELLQAIDENVLSPSYDFVSLLIGVNNQYQGRNVEEFRLHFRHLLQLAIQKAGGIAGNVIVLSIPDWGVTPFAMEKSPEKIRSEIDLYNFICQAESEHFQSQFINITDSQRTDGNSDDFLAPDKLHPSGKEYCKWSEQLAKVISDKLNGKLFNG